MVIDLADLADEQPIRANFHPYSKRGYDMIERYYDELGLQRAGVQRDPRIHVGNIVAALRMASGGLGPLPVAIEMCSASVDQALAVADAVFTVWRNGFGAVATSPSELDPAEIEQANASLAIDMTVAAREARCRVPIVFA